MSISEARDARVDDDGGDQRAPDPRSTEVAHRPSWVRNPTWWRRIALVVWAVAVVAMFVHNGVSMDRTGLLVFLCSGLAAASIGRRRIITVVVDWLPFAAVLVLYDQTRNVAQWMGMPTQWWLAVAADRHLFGGVEPTLWLQQHLKEATPPWWEIITSVVYVSFFVVPYAVAAVLWLRDRVAWRRFAVCFVLTSFLGLVGYTFVPAAPPWAAARCAPAEVVDHPRNPSCIDGLPDPDGGLLGTATPEHMGAAPEVERISARGWDVLHIPAASDMLQVGQSKANLVAAVPSLHAALTGLLALFMWPRVRALGRTLFVGYALIMAFTLVYTAEHYVFDILLGWGLAGFVVIVVELTRRRWTAHRTRLRERAHG
ncbi:phosphatase PAP2 family protein [Williamsia sterculiae]|uniref:PAP2 superfamily protein n=1 Tax=Williamsia sterculiae TaxID=1344003 RepID=A0A1N7CG77_9NOCA|nr:phosphatase PAP2 family protein [Williamsia sterculiae]SIR62631.1 PAP2 superfamily protein [Williamsia sterculiae]